MPANWPVGSVLATAGAVAVAAAAAAATAAGFMALRPAHSKPVDGGSPPPDAGGASDLPAKETGNSKTMGAKKKKSVLRLAPDTHDTRDAPSKGIVKRRPAAAASVASPPGATPGTRHKPWLAYKHENDSHPPAEAGWISYAHEGDEYQSDVHDTNRDPTLGQSWVLPSLQASQTLASRKSTPQLRAPDAAKLRPPPVVRTEPVPAVSTSVQPVAHTDPGPAVPVSTPPAAPAAVGVAQQ